MKMYRWGINPSLPEKCKNCRYKKFTDNSIKNCDECFRKVGMMILFRGIERMREL